METVCSREEQIRCGGIRDRRYEVEVPISMPGTSRVEYRVKKSVVESEVASGGGGQRWVTLHRIASCPPPRLNCLGPDSSGGFEGANGSD